ncbi:MAG: cytochrome c oxidase subunit II [Phycisphaerae bacterium]|nr:cytochrome c oxidase subunit II [Phycisphaerae bacterium]
MLASFNFGTYGRWLPPQLSEHGHRIDHLIDVVHYFMFALFVGWGIFFLYTLIRFRKREGHRAIYEPVSGKASKYAEVAVGAFEVFLLVGLSMPVWAEYKNPPPDPTNMLEVRVIGEQFQWDFHYPGPDGKFGRTDSKFITGTNPIGLDEADPNAADDIQTINEFHIPTGRDINVRITSKDVIHSFAIPTMRVKQDAIPGMEVPVWFKVKEGATTEKLKEEMTQEYDTASATWYKLRHHVSCEDYRDKSGQIILAKGSDLGSTHTDGTKLIDDLRAAGVERIKLQPRNPLEVICAQLCGNSHFKMKAQIITHDAAGFDAWVKERSTPVEIDFGGDF